MILKCELKKVFSKKINRIIFVVMLLLGIVFSGFAVGDMRYTDKEGVLHTGITAARNLAADRNRWQGELTTEKIEAIVKSRKQLTQQYPEEIPNIEYGKTVQSYDNIIDFVIGILTPDSWYDESVLYQLTDEQTANIYTTYQNNMQRMADEYGKTPEQKELLEKQYKKIKLPLTYEAKDSWDNMTMYAETYGIILAVVIGFLAAGIFDEEFRTGAEAVFFSTKYGRSKAIKNKIIAGIIMTTIVYWVGIGMLSLLSFGIMGISGFHTPYQIEHPYSIYPITYGQCYLIILFCGYIASLFAASATMLITAKTHISNVAICIPFFMYCIMPFIGQTLLSVSTIFTLTPDMLINIIQCTKKPVLFQIGSFAFRQIPFIMLLYGIISLVLLPFIYRNYCRYGLRRK